jgi:hypothetical protein
VKHSADRALAANPFLLERDAFRSMLLMLKQLLRRRKDARPLAGGEKLP